MNVNMEWGRGLKPDVSVFRRCELVIGGERVEYRAYEGLPYVERPLSGETHRLNLYVPEPYFHGGQIEGFTAETAPFFMPNSVGGYMPGEVESPGTGRQGRPKNTLFEALRRGCVVVSPAVRGRTSQDGQGRYIGKAPACIVDLKAAVRWLRHNRGRFPGDSERIITNGTSAGGALSALLGATGNHVDYEPYLRTLGAVEERDDVFAASCYCPITALDHADMAQEWQFCGIDEYTSCARDLPTGGLTEKQRHCARELKEAFPAYINSLELKGPDGAPLTLDDTGNGTFRDYAAGFVLDSAQRELDRAVELFAFPWVKVEGGRATTLDFTGQAEHAGRVKPAPGFDRLDLSSPENELFGTETVNARHFTSYGLAHSEVNGTMAETAVIRMMDPLAYLGEPGSTAARHWRIRHGTRDSSLGIQVLLEAKLRNMGHDVDFFMPWEVTHDGDYDLDDLFAWVRKIVLEP